MSRLLAENARLVDDREHWAGVARDRLAENAALKERIERLEGEIRKTLEDQAKNPRIPIGEFAQMRNDLRAALAAAEHGGHFCIHCGHNDTTLSGHYCDTLGAFVTAEDTRFDRHGGPSMTLREVMDAEDGGDDA